MTGLEEVFQQAMAAGHSAAWDGLWDQAVQHYRRALGISPQHPGALNNLALALYELQDYPAALQAYLQAARVAPEDALPVEKIAQIFERLGKNDYAVKAAFQAAELYLKSQEADKAIENWNRVLRLNPAHFQAHSRLAQVYERTSRPSLAVSEFIHIASLFQTSGELEKAKRTLEHALQVSPDESEALQALELLRWGQALPRPTRPEDGAVQERATQVSEDKPAAQTGQDPIMETCGMAIGTLAGMLFDVAEAEPEAEAAPRRGLGTLVRSVGGRPARGVDHSRILLHLSQAVELQTQGQVVQAAEELKRAIAAGLSHPAADFDLGLLWSDQARMEESIGLLQSAARHPDFSLGSRLLLGRALGSLGRWVEASNEYLEALRLADSAVAPAEQAEILSQLYEPILESQRRSTDPTAHQALSENIDRVLIRQDWRVHLAETRLQLPGANAGGIPTPLAEILTQSRSSQAVESLSVIHRLADADFLQSAMEEAYYALQQAPTFLPLHICMGDLLIKQDRTPDAVAKLVMVARTYFIRGETRQAIDLYRRVIALAPLELSARAQLIELLGSLGRFDETLQEYLGLADVFYDLADLESARDTLEDGLQFAQNVPADRSWRVRLLHRLADIDLQRLDWRQALRLYEQLRNLQPEDEKARQKLVELYDHLGQESQARLELDNYIAFLGNAGQYPAAAVFLEKLLREHKDQPGTRRRLGEVYSRMGRTAEAIAQLDAAGEAYLGAGDRASAVTVVEAILRLGPPNAANYQRLLARIRS